MIDQETSSKEKIAKQFEIEESLPDKGKSDRGVAKKLHTRAYRGEEMARIAEDIERVRGYKDFFDSLKEAERKKFIKEVFNEDKEMDDVDFHLRTIPHFLQNPEARTEEKNRELKSKMEKFKKDRVFFNKNPKTGETFCYMPKAYLPNIDSKRILSRMSEEEKEEWKEELNLGSEIIFTLNKTKKELDEFFGKKDVQKEEEKELQKFVDWKDTDNLKEALESEWASRVVLSNLSNFKTGEHYGGNLGISVTVGLEGRKFLSVEEEKVSPTGDLKKLVEEIKEGEIKRFDQKVVSRMSKDEMERAKKEAISGILAKKDQEGKYQFVKEMVKNGRKIEEKINPRLLGILEFVLLRETLPYKKKKEEVDVKKIEKEISLDMSDFIRFYSDLLLAKETKDEKLGKLISQKINDCQRVIREKLSLLGKLSAEEVENKDKAILFAVDENENGKIKRVEILRKVKDSQGEEKEEGLYGIDFK